MYLLDTNVVSETRKPRPDPNVTAWLEGVDRDALYVSVLTLGEARKGIARLRVRDPRGAEDIRCWLDDLRRLFADRLLPVDADVAERWGDLAGAGRTLAVVDGLLAATALVHGLTLVTRNVADVESTGVAVLDPWRA